MCRLDAVSAPAHGSDQVARGPVGDEPERQLQVGAAGAEAEVDAGQVGDPVEAVVERRAVQVQPFGGRYLARGTAAAAYELGQKERIVIPEFPSVEQANAAYNSPAYKKALEALGDGAVRDIRIVEGLD